MILRPIPALLCCLATPFMFAGAQSASASDSPSADAGKAKGKLLVYVGTYTGKDSKGIYLYQLDLGTGRLTPAGLAAETQNPSFLAIAPSGRFLFAANEISNFGGERTGAITSLAIEPGTGKLTEINQQSSRGAGPCHLVVDGQGKHVLAANYGGGSIVVIPVADDGRLGEATAAVQHEGSSVNPQRQTAPHAHSINLDPAGRFAFAADLGLDKILIYRFDPAAGTLKAHDPPAAQVEPGAGPRHFAFHPTGRFAYVINELNSTVTALGYDEKQGRLSPLQTVSTLPEGYEGNSSTAEVQVHPSGKFLYGSNRGHDSLAIFAIDSQRGTLTPIGHQPTGGRTPRNFGIDPTGQYILAANQSSSTICVFRIDPQSGKLSQLGEPIAAPSPVCVKFLAP